MRFFTVIGLLVLGFPLTASGVTHDVCPDGSGDFLTIQAAIDASTDTDVIELCDAIFAGDGNRDLDYGGRAITVRSQSGNPGACVIDCGGSPAVPHRGVYFHTGEGNDSVLEGVTIQNAFSWAPGGGVCCDGASPTITNCILRTNLCPDNGAGLLCTNASPDLTDCRFIDNGDGTAGGGAGMACLLASSPSLTDCVFEGNRAQTGGGGLLCGSSSPTLTGCSFSGNTLSAPNAYGGGLFCFYYASPTLIDCEFIDNEGDSGGGAAFKDHCDPSLTDCWFSGNSAQNGGGIYCLQVCLPTLDGCTFSNNTATIYGGAIWCSASSPGLTGCTLSGNSAGTNGGGLHLNSSAPTLEQTIIAFSASGEAVYCYDAGSSPTLQCCDLYGNAGGDWVGCVAGQAGTNGNIALDPLFCGAASEDYGLTTASPCAPFSAPNPQCDLIGAWPVGCTGSSIPEGDAPDWRPSVGASPNPFATATRIRYTAPVGSGGARIALRIFDAAGRLVRTLVDARSSGETQAVAWDGCDRSGVPVQAGVYFAEFEVGHEAVSRRVVVLR